MTRSRLDESGAAQRTPQPLPAAPAAAARKGLLRRAIDRMTATSEQVEAQQLLEQTIDRGSTPVLSCTSGDRVSVSGTIRAVSYTHLTLPTNREV